MLKVNKSPIEMTRRVGASSYDGENLEPLPIIDYLSMPILLFVVA